MGFGSCAVSLALVPARPREDKGPARPGAIKTRGQHDKEPARQEASKTRDQQDKGPSRRGARKASRQEGKSTERHEGSKARGGKTRGRNTWGEGRQKDKTAIKQGASKTRGAVRLFWTFNWRAV